MLSTLPEIGRNLPWSGITTWIAVLAATAFLALGARGLIDPLGAASSFGISGATANGRMQALDFMRATGARNMGLALLALALVGLDAAKPLAALLLCAAFIALVDFFIVANAASTGAAIKHVGYVVALSAFGIWIGFKP